MTLFEQNLQLLQNKNPELAQRVQQAEDDLTLTVQKSRTGIPTVVVEQEGRRYALHDPADPLGHAQRFVQKIDGLPAAHNAAMLGCGLGYIPLYLYKANPALRHFFIFEPAIALFRTALKVVDLSSLLKSQAVKFVVGGDPGQCYNALMENLMELVANSILQIDNQPVTAAFPQWAQNTRQQIEEALRLGKSGLATKFSVGPTTLKNLIRNLDWIARSPGIQEIGERCRNIPAVIVAAGPSLMKNIDVLRRHQQRLLILASDTAYNLLLNHGIVPEFVVTVDPTELNLKHFPAEQYGPDSFLIFDPEARSEIIGKFTHRLTYMTDKHPMFHWLDRMLGPKGTIPKGGMVSQAAMQVAFYLQCSPVILVGQDLALDPETPKTHAPAAALSRDVNFFDDNNQHVDVYTPDRSASNREQLFWVEGTQHEKVPTLHNFLVYLRMIEEDIRRTAIPVIDATEGGAKIAGTTVQTLEATVQTLRPNINLSEVMTELLVQFRQWKPAASQDVKKQMKTTLHTRHELAKQGLRALESQPNLSARQLEERMEAYRPKIFADPVAEFLIENAAPRELFEYLKLAPPNADEEEKHFRLIERWNALLRAVQTASQELETEWK